MVPLPGRNDDDESVASSSEPSLDPSAEGDWDDWEAEEGDNQATKCLFQDQMATSPQEALALDQQATGVDVLELVGSLRLGFYGAMKLINFIRAHVAQGLQPAEVMERVQTGQSLFRQDEEGDVYLQPVIPEDPLLYALTSLMEHRGLQLAEEEEDDEGEEPGSTSTTTVAEGTGRGGAAVTVAEGSGPEDVAVEVGVDAVKLEVENRALQEEVAELKARVARMGQLMADMDKDAVVPKPNLKNPDNDTYYFTSYAHYAIHETMLRDSVRTGSYSRAIEVNGPTAIRNKTVLDIGCGTGVLSMFAARAGAKKVVAVDCSDIINQAAQIVRDNGFSDVIQLVKGKMEEVTLPVERVDVIVSEWMGYCLLYESMLPSVLHARDRYLAEGGIIMPNRCTMFIQGMTDKEGRLNWWKNVYGLDMSSMRKHVTGEPAIEVLPASAIVTDKCLVKDLDLMAIKDSDLDFETRYSLKAKEDGVVLNGLVVHFDTAFEAPEGVETIEFSTGPDVESTHWRQAVFWLTDSPATPLQTGDSVEGTFVMVRNKANPREYDVRIKWEVRPIAGGGAVSSSGEQSYLIGS